MLFFAPVPFLPFHGDFSRFPRPGREPGVVPSAAPFLYPGDAVDVERFLFVSVRNGPT
jgi:hypothetical protein